VSVNEKKWLVMHMHVQLKLNELRGPPNPWLTVTVVQEGAWPVAADVPCNVHFKNIHVLLLILP
jgi:hypothetical protein